ncbi:hypothetical protein EJ05DRAFT_489500 [Pseudovirgaria hyperparasitica]|uniref:Uncharacterized protein n=1 Tax=Pseudovirgaria hyperparasitica TaxID=470096 RepID=A0A6A6VX37_9PEZI|nr:uncharacterized protein EJ05DRAFT_489500 [Pseudovirgaria hyperparasitica]KAF2754274.1 hypothetical protein EJ05DRAFT_489500 [Pseudovirgaria hyperparasitica]
MRNAERRHQLKRGGLPVHNGCFDGPPSQSNNRHNEVSDVEEMLNLFSQNPPSSVTRWDEEILVESWVFGTHTIIVYLVHTTHRPGSRRPGQPKPNLPGLGLGSLGSQAEYWNTGYWNTMFGRYVHCSFTTLLLLSTDCISTARNPPFTPQSTVHSPPLISN